ncbi:amino acid adenylation domain-containing protein [Streptomyces cinnamoneus]|uniref:Carrier domain-containing protein n=1 Tax=Streptomyces cinnamoneus TaxID=53446 RepID=A0A918WFZ2_STRCJ|nr:amino acid adenylation domain-containing protein [Streptomyces cinnamoneus]GHC43896.1 hypothetical protein GCM10010507_18470 [Streptomyces cinnamoneus]
MTTTPHAPAAPGLLQDAQLSPDERAAWRDFNDSTCPRPDGPALVHRLEEAAARRPDAPAVQAVDGTWTYRRLHAEADVLAALLARHGVREGDTVAVAATRRLADYAALLAALKAGCAYLPLAPDGPAVRQEFVLADSGAVALVADARAAAELGAVGGGLRVRIRTGGPEAAPPGWVAADPAAPAEGALPAPLAPAPRRTSYVIYTSGSTGTPKGVMTDEAALLNFCAWYVERHEVVPHDRLAQTAPLTFDPSVQQIFPAWATGACLVVVPEDVQREGGEFLDWLAAERITHLDIVTPHWLQLLEVAARRGRAALPALRWIVVGGETYFFHQTHQWHRVVDSPARLNTIYGPTEATVNATEFLVDPATTEGQVPIGVPLPNYRAYVLDEHGALCPPHITGELHLAGAGLARRYCSDEATRRAFHEAVTGRGEPERLYRTGDLARLVEHDGAWVLEFQGRTDSQVKVSGYRIELEEVQAALATVPGVTGCAVVLRTEPATQLVCGYVAEDRTPERVRAELAERLPAYMVPHVIAPVPAVPLTGNGKVDRDALLELVAGYDAGGGGDAPDGPVETAIASAWAQVLGLPVVHADDDFFARGGSSLLAFRVVALLREQGVTVRAADLLQARTVRALAARATTGAVGAPAPAAAPAAAVTAPVLLPAPRHELADGRGPLLVLPPATELALLGGDTEDTGDHAVLDLGLPPDTAPEAVRTALAEVIGRHPLLRARLDVTGARPALREVRVTRFDLPVVDGESSALADSVRPLLAARTGLRHGLPVAAALLRLPTGPRLLLAVRHLLVDGPALRRITAELAAGLGLADAPPPAPPLAEQLAALAAQARRMAPVPHVSAFGDAEREAQRRLGPLVTHDGTVTELELGELPASALPPGAAGEWEPRLVAAAALAVHRWLGLRTVPVCLPRQGRPQPARERGTGGQRTGDAVANLSDVAPLLVAAGDGGPDALRSAIGEWARRAQPFTHWSAAVLAHCPELAGRWPGRRAPLTGSFVVAVESAEHEAGPGGITGHDSPTAPDPAMSGAVQFTVVAGPDGLRLRLVAWDLPESVLKEPAALWRAALTELAGTTPASKAGEQA